MMMTEAFAFNAPLRSPICLRKRCKRPATAFILAGPITADPRLFRVCDWHFRLLDRANRLHFWQRGPPKVKTMHTDRKFLFAAYDSKKDTIVLTQNFATLTTERMLFALAHEAVHRVITRDVGKMTSIAFDIIYQRPLHCLGHHTLQTYELNLMTRQSEGSNTAIA